MPIANMEPEARRRVFDALRCQLLRGEYEFRQCPRVWTFERSPTDIVRFAIQCSIYEEGPDLSAHDGMLELMVKYASELPGERA